MNLKEVLRKLKLIDSFEITLEINKTQFLEKLLRITEISNVYIFNDYIFSSNKIYKGQIFINGFKLRKINSFFDSNSNLAIAEGKIFTENGFIKIYTELNAFRFHIIFMFIAFLVVSSIIIFKLINNYIEFDPMICFILPFNFLISVFIPFFLMRNSIKKLKYDLEREFYYLTKSE